MTTEYAKPLDHREVEISESEENLYHNLHLKLKDLKVVFKLHYLYDH